MKRLLSIDGGGIFGLIPALVLTELERRAGARCRELFDLVSGNSTGGILAVGLAAGVPAKSLAELYSANGATIFTASTLERLETADGLAGPKYDPKPLEEILQKTLGAAWLSDARPCELLVPATRCDRQPCAWWFRSWEARVTELDFPLWKIARATSAAPTYFPAAEISAKDGSSGVFVDGGLFANSPEDSAIEEARHLWPGEPLWMLSLGTGSAPLLPKVQPSWGGIDWLRGGLIEFSMQLQEQVAHERASLMLGENRVRLEPLLGGAMDDTSAENVARMQAAATGLIAAMDWNAVLAALGVASPGIKL